MSRSNVNQQTSFQVMQTTSEVLQTATRSLFQSGMGTLLLGLCLFTISMRLFTAKKGKISTGRFGGGSEKRTASAIARQQRKQRKHNRITLKASFLEIPEVQQGIAVCGAPNSGKTYSIIDPAIRDAIRQGFPIVVYDFKGAQIEAHAAYAAAQGYDVHVFAPGFPYTGVCNPLDFVRDASDSLMAGQLAEVIYKNTRRGSSASENDFFSNAGQKLVEAVMLLAKTTLYPDLLMAKKILNLPNLATRIRQAAEAEKVPIWTLESFSQLLSSEDAEKQVAGIVATAQRTFDKFIGKDLISSFVGATSIPLDLSGKQILFLQVDTQKRDVVAPLLAAILHLIIARNFAQPRKEPLVLSLDELPTLHLDGLPKWINEFRSYGFCPILGYQNFAQLQHTYGRELSKAIFAACGTKVFFNPRDDETAALASRYLGDKEVKLHTRSHTYGMQRSSSRNEQYQKVPLMAVDEILKLDQGECVFINPAYKGNGEASVPLKLKLKVSKQEDHVQEHSEKLWREVVRDRQTQRAATLKIAEADLDAEAEKRQLIAESQFPLNQNDQQSTDLPVPIAVGRSSEAPEQTSGELYDPEDYAEY
ncbi:type IV secretory system conjugative DNA transfer family protein [Phormidesmis priestleyi]